MQVDDSGPAVPVVQSDAPTAASPAVLGSALNKVTSSLNRRRRATFSAVVSPNLSPLALSVNLFCFLLGDGGSRSCNSQDSR